MSLLYQGSEWNFDTLKRVYDTVEEIALGELGLEVYPTQIEVITAEQMLDAYASVGLPLMYRHWSFGKHFVRNEALYRTGQQGLAYEIVINSDPCICYVMEENSMTMQALVIAHAAFGHNHFFRNNQVFRQWTDAKGILDYLAFARDFVARCEERHGIEAVERVLDAAHALQTQGVNRYARRPKRSLVEELARKDERRSYVEAMWNPLWTTVPGRDRKADPKTPEAPQADLEGQRQIELPEENLLYFFEKHSPSLAGWQREILRIVRVMSQYFYPQRQTKVMNEGCATYVHYRIMTRLHELGRISDGAYLEFLHSHTSVISQPDFNSPRYSGINPYALGFAMMQDIERICSEPTAEDRAWFPDIAGNGRPMATLREVWAEFRDESFILQFLSPKVIRDFRLMHLTDEADLPHLEVTAIHDEQGYRAIRAALAAEYECARLDPEIQVVAVDLPGDRRLTLEHRIHDGRRLDPATRDRTLAYVRALWDYPVSLKETDARTGTILPNGETDLD
ncbi:MAG TPA: SpoVR family protein [Rhodospirillaceae bacterium]|nr:SpoVR family protein [Rhodospirillaceae bacterium]